METNKRKEFEYKEVITDLEKVSFLLEGYESFGWEQDECIWQKEAYIQYPKQVVLRLKRSYKIINRTELTRLQRKYEACVSEMEKLEQAKTLMANIYSLTIGIIGLGFLAGAVVMLVGQPPRIEVGILFLGIAALGWILPIFVYKRRLRKDTKKLNLLIEEKYSIICETCKKGKRLLYKDA